MGPIIHRFATDGLLKTTMICFKRTASIEKPTLKTFFKILQLTYCNSNTL